MECALCMFLVLSGMIGRIAATGAIFKKILELNLTTIGQVTIGKIVNLAGYDVQRLDKVCDGNCCECGLSLYTFQFEMALRLCICHAASLQAFLFSIYVILTPMHVVVVTLLLWFYIGLGPSSLAGMGAVLIQIPLLYIVAKFYAKLR